MSGFVGHGRLQDGEWLMRACMIMNRDLPPGAPPFTEETVLNTAYTQEAVEFEDLLEKIDPEREIDRSIFPILAHFNAAEGWPLDLILAGFAAIGVWIFMPNYAGVGKFVGYLLVASYVAIQYLRTRRVRQRAAFEMQRLGLNPSERHPLTLRMLVRYRMKNATVH